MALFDDILNGGNLGTGLLVGVGALIAWPLISPIARPVAKSVIKGGLMAIGRPSSSTQRCRRDRGHSCGSPTGNQRDDPGAGTCRRA